MIMKRKRERERRFISINTRKLVAKISEFIDIDMRREARAKKIAINKETLRAIGSVVVA